MANNKQINQFPISGKVVYVGKPEQYTSKAGNTKTTRILVLEVFVGNYRNEVPFEFIDMNITPLNQIKQDDWVSVTFILRGNKSDKSGITRWFPRLEGLTVIKG